MSREGEVLSDRNVTRYASYVRIDEKSLNDLAKAKNDGNINRMFEVLKANSIFGVNSNLMDVYDSLAEEITNKVLDANASRLSKEGLRQAKIGAFKPSIPPPKVRVATKKTIEQPTKKGSKVRYKRSYPTKFNKREITYLRNNQSMNNKDLVITFNNYFPNRSTSSILTKKYRIKKK